MIQRSTRHRRAGDDARLRANRREPRARGLRTALFCVVVISVCLSGCPTYEDSYSGSYRETNVDSTRQRAVQVDLFRYGDYARAVLRYFEPDIVNGDPYGDETFCTWTSTDEFNDDKGQFELPITRSSRIENGRLTGDVSDDSLDVTLYDTESGSPIWETRQLTRVDSDPVEGCDFVGDFLMRANFDIRGEQTNAFPASANRQIDNPVFTVQWVGIESFTDPDTGDEFLAGLNAQGHAARLDSPRFDEQEQSLSGRLSLSLRPPGDEVLVENGTRFAIGHPVVVDDQASEGSFSWDGPPTEPIVAAALERGSRPGSDTPQANIFGRAIFFVEGELSELSPALQSRTNGIEAVQESQTPDAHFFLVDIAVQNDEILSISLPEEPIADRTIPLRMTDEFLEAGPADLPRLFPYE